MPFPDDFVWGTATSSYQIEGSSDADARGESIWDAFCRQPGAIRGGDTGATAADHLNRFREDIAIMRSIGLHAYRFSISWPRVLPEGTGAVNEAGLAFYDRLVDELLAAGITPWVTLYHWDLPMALHRRGGWQNPEIADWFEAYTTVVAERLSDRVTRWFTLNEPQIFIGHGYGKGEHAPGLRLPMSDLIRMSHNVLLAHGRSVRVLRAHAGPDTQIGWAPVCWTGVPRDEAKDANAAMAHMADPVRDPIGANTWWSDPVFLGTYPADGLKHYEGFLPKGWENDLPTIAQPLDFCAVNMYFGDVIEADGTGPNVSPKVVPQPPGAPRTGFGWPLTPGSLYWGPTFLWERYRKPVIVAENGIAIPDWVNHQGRVEDPQRIDYITRHLASLRCACDEGVPIRGYFLWSLMDNFEWAEGYHQRFGIVHVDFQTQKRTPKASSGFYSRVIETNGEVLDQPEAATAHGPG